MTGDRGVTPDWEQLRADWPGGLVGEVALIALDRVASTQDLARALLDRHFAEDEEPHPFAVVARAQSAGHGRRGRRWESGEDLGVWASLALPAADEALAALPMRSAVALASVVADETGACGLKWPNDLLIGRDKVGGLLVDAVSSPTSGAWAVVGFGINHGHSREQLPVPAATSLALAAGERPLVPLGRFAARCLATLWRELSGADPAWVERYRQLSVHREGDAIAADLEGERVEGRFAGFDDAGFLLLDTGSGRRRIHSGEVYAW